MALALAQGGDATSARAWALFQEVLVCIQENGGLERKRDRAHIPAWMAWPLGNPECAAGLLVSASDLTRCWLFGHAVLIMFLLCDFPLP